MINLKIVEFRKSQNLSIQEMSEKVGISRSYYEKIEYGDRSPSYNFLKKFKLAFPTAETESIFLSFNHT